MSEVMVGTGGNNVEMIVGVVVALVLLILVMLVVIILTLFLLKRRMMLRHIKMAGATGVADFANPNYECKKCCTNEYMPTKNHIIDLVLLLECHAANEMIRQLFTLLK